ncbi:MAG: hypothetical protein KF893_26210 [Caldilineaceae bacterium]|nr:hypothetical protein [Caldilineaceae bacterium]
MAVTDIPNAPEQQREVVSLITPDGFPGWSLRLDDGPLFQLVELAEGRWELRQPTGAPYPKGKERVLELEVPSPGRDWPTDAALAGQRDRIRAAGGDWLADLLPWTPHLIVGVCRDEEDRKRAARLTLLFAGLVTEDDPVLRITLFHLRRLAWQNLAELYETATKRVRSQMEAVLRRSLYAWQDEIARQERRGFFRLTLAEQEAQAEGKRFLRVYEVEDRTGIQDRREQAMKDVLLTGAGGQRRLRALFRDSDWGKEMATSLLQGWFLPRYDLDMAERLKVAAQTEGWLAGWGRFARFSVRALMGGVSLAFLYFVFWLVVWRFLPAAQWVGVDWVTWGSRSLLEALINPLSQKSALDWLEWTNRGLACAVYVVVIVQVVYWLLPGAPDISLPRLRAGMFLGVVGTLLQQNWNGLLHFSLIHPLALGFLCAGLGAVSWQVLLAKVAAAMGPEPISYDRRTQGSAPTALGRCWDVFWRAGALAFLLSFLLVDFLSDSYLVCQQETVFICEAAKAPGVVAGTYPSLVLLFTAILLFAGIFGQLLWDEKPLTEAVA